MEIRTTKVNKTDMSTVIVYDQLKMLVAEAMAKKSGVHQMTIYNNMEIEYEPKDCRFGRLIVRVSVDHNEVKAEKSN